MAQAGRIWLAAGALLGGAAVALGAFGAHGLREFLERRFPAEAAAGATPFAVPVSGAPAESPPPPAAPLAKRLANFDTATRYTMYHALALLALGLLCGSGTSRAAPLAGMAFVLGVLLFSGLLYAMVFGAPKTLGAVVPIGGVLLIAGWLLLALAAFRARN